MKKAMLFFAVAVMAFGANAQGDSKMAPKAADKTAKPATTKMAPKPATTAKPMAKPAAKTTDAKSTTK